MHVGVSNSTKTIRVSTTLQKWMRNFAAEENGEILGGVII